MVLSLLLAAVDGGEAVTLPGTLLDADGQPVAGAEVWLADGSLVNPRGEILSEGQVPMRPKTIAHQRSDASGRFAVELPDDLPQSDWSRTWCVLWARHPGSAICVRLVARDLPPRAAPVMLRLAAAPPLTVVVARPRWKTRVGREDFA